ncbi:unnamed protein product, partial [Iphiclides podalirius]
MLHCYFLTPQWTRSNRTVEAGPVIRTCRLFRGAPCSGLGSEARGVGDLFRRAATPDWIGCDQAAAGNCPIGASVRSGIGSVRRTGAIDNVEIYSTQGSPPPGRHSGPDLGQGNLDLNKRGTPTIETNNISV